MKNSRGAIDTNIHRANSNQLGGPHILAKKSVTKVNPDHIGNVNPLKFTQQ
jgi:hypothetical protein